MEEIPDITSDMIEHLRRRHIDSVYQLAVQTPIELALKMYDDDSKVVVDIKSVSILIANARKVLTENGNLSKEFSTADEMRESRKKISRYTTGSEKFDAFLNDGFESQSITELAGEFGSGKAQICHREIASARRHWKNC